MPDGTPAGADSCPLLQQTKVLQKPRTADRTGRFSNDSPEGPFLRVSPIVSEIVAACYSWIVVVEVILSG